MALKRGAGGRHILRGLALTLVLAAAGVPAPAAERVALVIGNAAYSSFPLANPRHDAEAMAELLQSAGFKVDRQLDATQEQLKTAVLRFGAAIRESQVKFAMFYYAGHGVQVDWRNYLIPVDAKVRNADDVRHQTVDVSELLRHMDQTKGKSFLVVLDACRDDPFAGNYRAHAKGLSQFDAPVGSLLAYATAPGNVALDGEGRNGLYTSHLLREFAVRGTRLEDAFKRVRLNVRLASKGLQIPWESTSLEEDVYLFPTERKKLSDAEHDRALEQEINHWLQVKSSTDTHAIADFLRLYPSGSASELALSRLNRLLAAAQTREDQRLATARASAQQVAQELKDAQARAQAALLAAQEAKAAQLAAVQAEAARLRAAEQEAARMRRLQEETAAQVAAQAAAARQAEQRSSEAARQALLEVQQRAQRARKEQLLAEQEEAQRQAAARAALARLQEEQAKAAETARQAEQAALAAQQRATEQSAAQAQAATTVAPAQLAATPYFKGYAEHHRGYEVGDRHEFQVLDRLTKSTRLLNMRVSMVDLDSERIEYNDGEYLSDPMGNIVRNLRGGMNTPRQFYPADLFVGKKWRTEFRQSRPGGVTYHFYYDLKVVGRERVTVPAGTFDTFKIEARGHNTSLGARLERNIWVAPGVPADIAHETFVRLGNGFVEQNDRQELLRLDLGSAHRMAALPLLH